MGVYDRTGIKLLQQRADPFVGERNKERNPVGYLGLYFATRTGPLRTEKKKEKKKKKKKKNRERKRKAVASCCKNGGAIAGRETKTDKSKVKQQNG